MITLRSIALIFTTSLAGCFGLLEPEPAVDGESCDGDDQCKSGSCVGGMCTGTTCDGPHDCQRGFICEDPGTLTEVISLGLAEGSCAPTCDVCPLEEPRWSCSEQQRCFYDGNPIVTAGGPYEAVAGEPVRLTGTAALADGHEIATVQWDSWSDGRLGEELEVDAVFMTPGSQEITLTVNDDAYGYGTATAQVNVCSSHGGSCAQDLDCCDDGELVCVLDSSYSGRCGPPPVCGDGVREGLEACDGSDTPALDCTELGQYHPGPAACGELCAYDETACQWCGQSFDDCTSDADCCTGYACSELGDCHSA